MVLQWSVVMSRAWADLWPLAAGIGSSKKPLPVTLSAGEKWKSIHLLPASLKLLGINHVRADVCHKTHTDCCSAHTQNTMKQIVRGNRQTWTWPVCRVSCAFKLRLWRLDLSGFTCCYCQTGPGVRREKMWAHLLYYYNWVICVNVKFIKHKEYKVVKFLLLS